MDEFILRIIGLMALVYGAYLIADVGGILIAVGILLLLPERWME